MPQPARGEVRKTDDGYSARITVRPDERETFQLHTSIQTEDAARVRSNVLAGLAQRFRKAKLIDTPEARKLLEAVASAAEALLAPYLEVADKLCGGLLRPKAVVKVPTFEQIGKQWTSGELHERFPLHVSKKKSQRDIDQDASRLKRLCDIDVGGMRAGDVPIDQFNLGHAEAMARSLPETAVSAMTQRQYVSLIGRVLSLAVYPCKWLTVSPLPKGFIPKAGDTPLYPFLYPDEEAALMSAPADRVPLSYRMLFGFMTRNGCRKGEACALQMRDFDLNRGTVTLNDNKTSDPRKWVLDPAVHRTLVAWVALKGLQPEDFMFTAENGGAFTDDHRLADLLREFLLEAGVKRHDLHTDSYVGERLVRGKLRVHDLRSTFVTLSLNSGRPEKWVTGRTGHRSSSQLSEYDRQRGEAEELGLGWLLPMDEAIPEFRKPQQSPAPSPRQVPRRGARAVNRPQSPRIFGSSPKLLC